MRNKSILFLFILIPLSCSEQNQQTDTERSKRLEQYRQSIRLELGPKYAEPIPAATTEQLKRGSELYHQLCAACHGSRGDGSDMNANALVQKPADLTNPQEADFFSEQASLHIIKRGIPGTAMMGWENILTEKDLFAVYGYIRSLIKDE